MQELALKNEVLVRACTHCSSIWEGAGRAAQLQLPWLKWPQAGNCTVWVCKSWEHADNISLTRSMGKACRSNCLRQLSVYTYVEKIKLCSCRDQEWWYLRKYCAKEPFTEHVKVFTLWLNSEAACIKSLHMDRDFVFNLMARKCMLYVTF